MLVIIGGNSPKMINIASVKTRNCSERWYVDNFGVGSHKMINISLWESKSAQNSGNVNNSGGNSPKMINVFQRGAQNCSERW